MNEALATKGNTYQIDLQNSANGKVEQTTTNKYTVNGVVTFKGRSATELMTDTTVLSGAGAGAVTKVKTYFAQTGATYSTFGNIASMTLPVIGSYDLTMYYTPPIETPTNLVSGQTYSVNSAVKFESNSAFVPAGSDINVKYVFRFLGIETITTPAGTFKACKTQTESVSTSGTDATTSWLVAEGRYKGLPLKSDNGKGTVSETTKLLFNGS